MIAFFISQIKNLLENYGQDPVLGLYYWQYAAVAALCVATVVVTWIVLQLLKRILVASEVQLEAFGRLQRRAYYVTSIGMVLYAKSLVTLPEDNVFFKNTFIVLNVIFAIMSLIVVNRLIDVLFSLVGKRMKKAQWEEAGVLQLLKSMAKVGAISVTFVLLSGLFSSLGFSVLLQNITIGAGTFTAIIAFASKDLVSNFFGALVVTVGKPFKIGDWIIVNKLEGRVMTIGVRDTKLETAGGVVMYIPNSTFISKHISNYGKTVYMPVTFNLMWMDASEKSLESFLHDLDELLSLDTRLKKKQCRIEMREAGLQKGKLTLHLYFNKITEQEKATQMRAIIAKVTALAQAKSLKLES